MENELPLLVQYDYFDSIKDYFKRNENELQQYQQDYLYHHKDNSGKAWYDLISRATVSAIRLSRLRVLKYFIDEVQLQLDRIVSSDDMIRQAAVYSNFDTMLFLDTLGISVTPSSYRDALSVATTNPANLKMIKWLSVRVPEPYKHDAPIEMAGYSGNMKIVSWLLKNRPNDIYDITRTLQYTLNNNQIDIANFLLNKEKENNNSTSKKIIIDLDSLATNGYLVAIKWVFENNLDYECQYAIDHAASRGYLECVKWLHEHLHDRICASTIAMDLAANHCHLDVVQWLHQNRTEGCTNKAMDNVFMGSVNYFNYPEKQFEVLKWLHYNRTEGCSSRAMDEAARVGHLDAIKFLHCNRTEGASYMAMSNALTAPNSAEIMDYLWKNNLSKFYFKFQNK